MGQKEPKMKEQLLVGDFWLGFLFLFLFFLVAEDERREERERFVRVFSV